MPLSVCRKPHSHSRFKCVCGPTLLNIHLPYGRNHSSLCVWFTPRGAITPGCLQYLSRQLFCTAYQRQSCTSLGFAYFWFALLLWFDSTSLPSSALSSGVVHRPHAFIMQNNEFLFPHEFAGHTENVCFSNEYGFLVFYFICLLVCLFLLDWSSGVEVGKKKQSNHTWLTAAQRTTWLCHEKRQHFSIFHLLVFGFIVLDFNIFVSVSLF